MCEKLYISVHLFESIDPMALPIDPMGPSIDPMASPIDPMGPSGFACKLRPKLTFAGVRGEHDGRRGSLQAGADVHVVAAPVQRACHGHAARW